MNWYYVDGPLRVGPLSESQWAELAGSGKIQPGTLVWHEGLTKWTPYSEVAPAPKPEAAAPEPEASSQEAGEEDASPEAFAARVEERTYSVGIRSSLFRSWRLFAANFWMLAGSTLLIYVLIFVAGSIPLLAMAMPLALNGVLMGGLYIVYLRLMHGQSAAAGDLFSGFAPGMFRNLALQTLVTTTVSAACFMPLAVAIGIVGVKAAAAGATSVAAAGELDLSATSLVLLLITLACAIPAVYFRFCWMFAVPLVVEKGLPFWPAMRLSRHKVLQHPWRISLLLIVAGLIAALPAMVVVFWVVFSGPAELTMEAMQKTAGLAQLSMAFTQPVYIGALLYLYWDMFGKGGASSRLQANAPDAPPADSD